MTFSHWVVLAGQVMEAVGVAVMVLGAVLSLVLLALRGRRPAAVSPYRQFRQDLGRAILLGLEFLVAADIIRTVSEKPTLEGVVVLGLIVVIRTFLSFTLTVELEGQWPWQRPPEHEEARGRPSSSAHPRARETLDREHPAEH
ncbi:DUF1622 domain-containing protein [Hyalangium rubrum]|uniref:DUF1622 domain-containing protein n=1 Tax=Hyalangium rubrum TaxID=3103134 RepID=A0ABU5H293_9BACT|nr:DUF1622 domain-containing protein [Hyalangium sp. s54d21]MDY7227571.1 DUF1622 domain-containing protein [Hyalangium sp. s54d21]